jgi:hypothetical protein
MTGSMTSGARGAALVMCLTGLVTLLGSTWTWGTCPTTPCGGILQAISEYSGLDLGFGAVTAGAGLALVVIGLASLRTGDVFGPATTALLLAVLIVATAGAAMIWMYVLPGDDKEFYWPPFAALLVGAVGLIALVASLRLLRTMSPRDG